MSNSCMCTPEPFVVWSKHQYVCGVNSQYVFDVTVVLWFSPSWKLSTTQPLTHPSPSSQN